MQMNKPFRETEVWKWLRTILEILALLGLLFLLSWIVSSIGHSDALADEPVYDCWVFCNPGSEVKIRLKPNKHAEVTGTAVCGKHYRTDWTEKNGFVHVSDVGNEWGEGWISAKYITISEPMILHCTMTVCGKGRVAVRDAPDGKRIRWVMPGTELAVYCEAEDWVVTEIGYIMRNYLGAY